MATQLTSTSNPQRMVEIKDSDAGDDAKVVSLSGLVALAKPTAGSWTLPVPTPAVEDNSAELKLLNATGQAHVVNTGSQTLTFGTKAGAIVVLVAYAGVWNIQSADPSVTVA